MGASRPPTKKAGINPYSFFTVHEFMTNPEGLGLKGVALNVYALIHSFSKDGSGEYFASNAVTAHRAGCGLRQVIKVLQQLEDDGLIHSTGWHGDGGQRTKRWVVDQGVFETAVERCKGKTESMEKIAGPLEDASCAKGAELPPAEVCTECTGAVRAVRTTREGNAHDSKHIENVDTKEEDGSSFDEAFSDVLRSYPFCRDKVLARRMYGPLYDCGVRAPDVSSMLARWAARHPGASGKAPFYPELSSFLDPNNLEGYVALADEAERKRRSEEHARVRRLTQLAFPDDMYELFAEDGCDERATDLWRRHLAEDGGLRGEAWNAFFQYVQRNLDYEARIHWLEARGGAR